MAPSCSCRNLKRGSTEPLPEDSMKSRKIFISSEVSLPNESKQPGTEPVVADLCGAIAKSNTQTILDSADTSFRVLEGIATQLRSVDISAVDTTGLIYQNVALALQSETRDTMREESIVGVVGSTGAGKSSLINALLDYEHIAPAGGLGESCTAIATEFRYREAGDKKFKANVVYVTREEFLEEARILVEDMLLVKEEMKDNNTPESQKLNVEAEVAWRKLSAVLPGLKKDEILGGDKEEPRYCEDILEGFREMLGKITLFGTTETVQTDDELEFSEKVAMYVTSNNGDDDNEETADHNSQDKKYPLWPLVKEFRIYLEAGILKDGVVLVDLPGQGDSNPARNRVAERYQQKADAIVIAMEIKRAVDNKTGDKILKKRIKQQLAINGIIPPGSMIFVCTKSDDSHANAAMKESWGKKELSPVRAQIKDNKKDLTAKRRNERKLRCKLERAYAKQTKAAKAAIATLPAQLKELAAQIKALEAIGRKLDVELEFAAINARNNIVKLKLARKLLENSAEAPVFTVSSFEYQTFRGRFGAEQRTSKKFHNIEDTEIPALRRKLASHAIERHKSKALSFLQHTVEPILRNLHTFQSMEQNLTGELLNELTLLCTREAETLEEDLLVQKETLMQNIAQQVADIVNATVAGQKEAYSQLERRVNSWRKYGSGGIWFMTFRAVLNRSGIFEKKDININRSMCEPMNNALRPLWPEFIQQQAFDVWAQSCHGLILAFQTRFQDRLSPAVWERHFKDLEKNTQIRAEQLQEDGKSQIRKLWKNYTKRIHHGFEKVLQKRLKATYTACKKIRGPGTYPRVCDLMIQDIRDQDILTTCVKAQRDALALLVTEVEKMVVQVTDNTLKQLRQDYQVVLKKEPKKASAKETAVAKKRIGTMLEEAKLLLNGCLERGLMGAVPRVEEEMSDEEIVESSGDDGSDFSDFRDD